MSIPHRTAARQQRPGRLPPAIVPSPRQPSLADTARVAAYENDSHVRDVTGAADRGIIAVYQAVHAPWRIRRGALPLPVGRRPATVRRLDVGDGRADAASVTGMELALAVREGRLGLLVVDALDAFARRALRPAFAALEATGGFVLAYDVVLTPAEAQDVTLTRALAVAAHLRDA